MNTTCPYDKGGNTLEEVIDNIFDSLKHKHEDSGEEVVTLARSGFKEICEHIAELQTKRPAKTYPYYPYTLDEGVIY